MRREDSGAGARSKPAAALTVLPSPNILATMPISLRSAGNADEQFLFELYASTRREEVAAWHWPEAQVAAFLQMQFRAQRLSYESAYPGAQHSLVLEDGRPIGRLLVWRGQEEVRLIDISLLAAARGRGVGSQLIRELMHECAGGRRLTLQVLVTNPARRLYLRLGFRRTGGDTLYDQMEWTPGGSEERA